MYFNIRFSFLAMATVGFAALTTAEGFVNGTLTAPPSIYDCIKACGSNFYCQSGCSGIVQPSPPQIAAATHCLQGCDDSDVTCKFNCHRNPRNSTANVEKVVHQLMPNVTEISMFITQPI